MGQIGGFGLLQAKTDTLPYFMYRKVTLVSSQEFVIFPIEYGFWYLMRKIHIKYPSINDQATYIGSLLSFELYQRSQNILQQVEPIESDLFSSPGSSGVLWDGVNMTASAPKFAKLQNIVYPFRDSVEIRVEGYDGVIPNIVDILILGYLIPANKLKMWDGANA